MTRKRFVKLMMAQGRSRNAAEAHADFALRKYGCYATAYNKPTWTVSDMTKAWADMMQAVSKASKALAAGIEAFGKAYREAMDRG